MSQIWLYNLVVMHKYRSKINNRTTNEPCDYGILKNGIFKINQNKKLIEINDYMNIKN